MTSGEPYLFEIETNNPYERAETFRVVIDDEDFNSGHIRQRELKLIDNQNSEWDHWYNNYGGMQKSPSKKANPSAVVRGSGGEMELPLQKCEKCNILFKF